MYVYCDFLLLTSKEKLFGPHFDELASQQQKSRLAIVKIFSSAQLEIASNI